ncbi:unnamed protein product [Phyllotreta striolata]|uniref:Alpha-taxilin n=1 Tax=Phyllotreta striolata TaxID=444603 RepID=A0A9N9TFT9_PHYSR|nr:unnamed protein product [Phyllotreta striolata]
MESNPKGKVPVPTENASSGSSNDHNDENRVPPTTGAIKKKREEKRSKRDQRSWDNLIKSLSNLPDSEKFDIIKEKYSDLYNEYRTTVTSLKTCEKTIKNIQREKEHIQAELSKNILSRCKLENLARELQKQNKEIKEENYNKLKEEEEKRREVASNFSEKLNTLTQLMDENNDKSIRLRDENINMTTKLTELYNQFQEREAQMGNMNKQMELQKKLSENLLKKVEFEFEAQREIWKKERTLLVANFQKSDETNKVLQEKVKSMQQQLESYQKQYTVFETTMKRSNKVFDSVKDEMTKMQKANAILERDRNEWHGRWKGSTQKCLQLTEMNQTTSNDLKITQKKVEALEKLCRTLQTERAYYLQQLKAHNITTDTPVEEDAGSKECVEGAPVSNLNNQSDAPGGECSGDSSKSELSKDEVQVSVALSEPELNIVEKLEVECVPSIASTTAHEVDSECSETISNSTSHSNDLVQESSSIVQESSPIVSVPPTDSEACLPNKEEKTE